MTERKSRLPLVADIVIIACVAVFSASWWSAHKLLNQDEMFSYQTDTVRTFAEVIRIQRHYPISLDPLVYHALAHLCVRLFGASAFSMRLPSMLGYALMLGCMYVFCYRAARAQWSRNAARRLAWLAAMLPMLTATFYYAVEGRPYGLLLGFSALTLVVWQAAARDSSSRKWSLPLLVLAVALALNTHYFAVLLLPVVTIAEAVRTAERRRIDGPMVAALLIGTAGIAGTLPFQPAVRAFRAHYYSAGTINHHAITQAYRSLLVDYTATSHATQHVLAILFVAAALLMIAALVLRWRALALPRAEAALLIALAALPFFGFLLAHFVTHSYEVRYVLAAIIGMAILLTLLIAPWVVPVREGGRAGLQWLPHFVAALVVVVVVLHVRDEERKTNALLASLDVPAAVRAALAADPQHNLYVQQMGPFELAQFYQPDAFVRSHTVLVYDAAREIQYSGHDTEALTAEHMRHFTALPILSYDTLRHNPAQQTWLLYNNGWDFAHEALQQDRATIVPLAPFADGTAATVQFNPQH